MGPPAADGRRPTSRFRTDKPLTFALCALPLAWLAARTFEVAGFSLGPNPVEALIHGLEALLGLRFLDAKVYFITDLPTRIEWSDVLQISLTAFGLCCLSTLYPSWRAARTQPAQSLRHE